MARDYRPGSPDNPKVVFDGMEHLILCEGIDAWGFLVGFLNSEELSVQPAYSTVFQVENFGGNEELPTKLQLWSRAPGFDHIKTVTVIRDAERDAEAAVRRVIRAFQQAELPAPSRPYELAAGGVPTTGFLLFPGCSEQPTNGTLEDLCLSILNEEQDAVLREIDLFLSSLKDNAIREFPREFKTRLHTYFSVTDDYVSLKVGEAARAGAFNWASPSLKPLKDYLAKLL